MLEYKLKNWKDVVDLDPPLLRITEESREKMIKYAKAHIVGDVRLAMGRFYTDAECMKQDRRKFY